MRPPIPGYIATQIGLYPVREPCLDVGCGLGQRYDYAEMGFETHHVYRLDKYRDVDTVLDVQADVYELPYPDDTWGTLLCTELLEHLVDPQAAVIEMARVLQPGGILFLSAVAAWPHHEHPHDYWRFTPQGLATLISRAGLEILSDQYDYPETNTRAAEMRVVAGGVLATARKLG